MSTHFPIQNIPRYNVIMKYAIQRICFVVLFLAITGCAATRTVQVIEVRTDAEIQALPAESKQRQIVVGYKKRPHIPLGTQFAIYDQADTAGKERKAVVTIVNLNEFSGDCRVEIQYEPIKPGDWGKQLHLSADGHHREAHILRPELHPHREQGHDPTE